MRPIEREFTLSDAKDRVIKEIDNLGLTWRKEVYGKNILTIVVTLIHPHNKNQTGGVGKGDYDNAFVGALFEALEHYIEDFSSPLATVRPAKNLMRTGILASDDVLDMVNTQPDSHLATRRFASSAGDFYYPLALCDPNYSRKPLADDNFDYRYLARYGSNSGIAIGATRNEALLHGINECIERDAFSLFLIHSLYSRSPCKIYEIDKQSLPEEAARNWQKSEEEIQERIRVLDITQGMKCRTYLALAEKSKLIKYPIGCGTSLHPHHALQRALSELVQINAVFNHRQEIQRENEVLHQRLLRYKRLERCFCMRTADIFNTNEVLLCRLPVSDKTHRSPAEDLVEIEQDLTEKGFVIGKSILYETSQVCLTHALIPNFERFYIITSGNIVLPLLRGRRSLEKKHI